LGTAVSNGFDVAALAHVTHDFTLGMTVAYTNAHFTETVGSGTVVLVNSGDKLPSTFNGGIYLAGSPWSVTLSPQYTFPAIHGYPGYVRLDGEYHSHNSGPFADHTPGTLSYDPTIPAPPATTLINFRTGMTFAGLDASLFVNNLFNAHPILGLSHDAPNIPLYRAFTYRPLTVGATLAYRF
jgi:outer membrane receptor protein involved in Fe transport